MEKENISVIPTLRPNMNISYEFLVVSLNDQQQYDFLYFNGLNSEKTTSLIDVLTYPVLTDQSKQAIYGQGSTTVIDFDFESDGDVEANGVDPNGCFQLTFTHETCLSVSQDGVGSLCCKCQEHQTSSVRCEGVSGVGISFGGNDVVSSGGGGGGSFSTNGGNNPSVNNLLAYLDCFHHCLI